MYLHDKPGGIVPDKLDKYHGTLMNSSLTEGLYIEACGNLKCDIGLKVSFLSDVPSLIFDHFKG